MITPIFVMPKFMRLRSTILLLVLLLCHNGYAQLQNNNWCMGRKGGVSFNTNPPTGFLSQMNSIETTASISDRYTGKLLFYTDGSKIWDANHNIMSNGREVGLDSTLQSGVQGAVIIPFIDDTTKYYLFTLRSSGPQYGDLYYSVVDMKLNGGLGGVVPNQKKIKIGERLTEAMTLGVGCNKVWLLTQKRNTSEIHAYCIRASGIDTDPVISTTPYPEMHLVQSYLRMSPDNKTLISIGNIFSANLGNQYISMLDFDNNTGRITSGTVIDRDDRAAYYGCEFSADGKMLYAISNSGIYQYDFSLTSSAIAASRELVKSNAGCTGLQRNINGDICVVKYEKGELDVISNATARVPNCIYTDNAITILGKGTYNLPQAIVYPIIPRDARLTSTDTALCNGLPIVLKAPSFVQSSVWQDGSTNDSFVVNQSGVFWVRTIDENCVADVDTYNVEAVVVDAIINNDTTICIGDELTLRSTAQPSGTNFTWSNGSTTDTTVIEQSGRYQLKATYKGCSDTDEVIVTHYPRINIELGNDTQICKGNAFMLPQIESSDFDAKYLWQDGSTGRTFEVTQAGKYQVTLSNQCQTIKDSVIVTGRNCHFFFPSGFTPNGDGRNDIARLVGDVGAVQDFTLRIFNRWGELVFLTDNPTLGWDGNYKNQKAEVGVYYYQIQYKYLGEKELMKGDLMLIR